jgi:hypothetical protein
MRRPPHQQRPTSNRPYEEVQISLQERQTRAAEKLNCITVWAAMVGLVGIIVLIGTLFITKQSADTGTKQLELSERPWVSEEITLASPLTFTDNNGGFMTVNIALKGLGNSVALNIYPKCELGMRRVEALENEVCGPLGKRETGRQGYMLFPGEPLILNSIGVGMSQSEIDETIRTIRNLNAEIETKNREKKSFSWPLPEELWPVLVCCVDYRFAFDAKHHQTRRAYMVGIPGLFGIGSIGPIKPMGVAKDTVLTQSLEGNSAD